MRRNYFRIALIVLTGLLSGCSSSNPTTPHILIRTQAGEIEVELYPRQAPKTVTAFLSYIDSGFYRNSSFYRVLNDDNQSSDAPKSELIQGGIWRTDYKKAVAHQSIPHETTQQTHILHKDGVISLARTAPGTAGTEFFICIGDQPGFDYGGENKTHRHRDTAVWGEGKGVDIVLSVFSRPRNNQTSYPPPVLQY